jgi:hypothetical protein
MSTRVVRLAFILLACAVACSCSSSNGGPDPGDTTPPTVTQVSLADGQTDVGLIERIAATFSEDMDASTINNTTITVVGRGVGGHVEYDEATREATFIPDTLYTANVWHGFILRDDIADEAGNTINTHMTSFQAGPFDDDHLADCFEPNESPPAATPIDLGRRYRTLSVTLGDHDTFEFTLAETAMVRVLAWMKAVENQTWNCEFERSDGEDYVSWSETVASGDSLGAWTWAYTFLPGTYYFHTHSHPTWDGYLLYDFELSPEEPCHDDRFEDNDFVEDCVEVVEGSYEDLAACWKDSDWYRIDLDAGDELTLSLTCEGWINTWRVTLYGPEMDYIGEEYSGWTPLSLSHTATTTGPHFFEVYATGDREYAMEIAVE